MGKDNFKNAGIADQWFLMPEITITVRARLALDDLGIAMDIGILVMFGLFDSQELFQEHRESIEGMGLLM